MLPSFEDEDVLGVMTRYKVVVTSAHTGSATTVAETEEKAWVKAGSYGKEDISWSDEFEASDVQEEE